MNRILKSSKNTNQKTTEIIKKGKYRIFNGIDYETIHLQTTSDQVIESDAKKFVSQSEKNIWNGKADGSHKHDDRYYQQTETFSQTQINDLLSQKASATHRHDASNIDTTDALQFVTRAQKIDWTDNTYRKNQVNTLIDDVNQTIIANETSNSNAHAALEAGYKSGDTKLQTNITTVQDNLDTAIDDLTDLINAGGTANTDLQARVEKIEKTDLPTVRTSVANLDVKLSAKITDLETLKADKIQVATDIASSAAALITKINLKTDKTYVDGQLATKVDKGTTYTKTEVDDRLATKPSIDEMNSALALKVDATKHNSDLALKADKKTTEDELKLKADLTYVNASLDGKANTTHTHTSSQITGLGTASSKNVGVANGQIPILDVNGKLADSVIPKIAINEVFTADNISTAMEIAIEIGDILIMNSTIDSSAFIVDTLTVDVSTVRTKANTKKLITYGSPKRELSDEYIAHMKNGKMTYLCVDSKSIIFEDKFKPLQSMGDTISSAEVQTALRLKLDKAEFETYKSTTADLINTKANIIDVYSKVEANSKFDGKVDKVTGKSLSKNDFTDTLKLKLDNIADEANNYVHPIGDANLHVPATSTTNNGRVLMAGITAGAMSWTSLTANHIAENSSKRFITDEERTKWNGAANGDHTHDIYRLISDSLSTSQTKIEINKLKTIVSTTAPANNIQIEGAVWIETTS